MLPSRRIVLAAGASAGLTSLESPPAIAATTRTEPAADADLREAVAHLVALSEASNAALMRGDAGAYQAMIALTDDFTLMSPFGGPPTHATQITPESMQAMGRFFRNGTLTQEVVQTYGSADMVVLVLIERAHVEVGGLPAQDWALRVTLVYRREDGGWRLAHRHADPLVAGIDLTRAAALAGPPSTDREAGPQ